MTGYGHPNGFMTKGRRIRCRTSKTTQNVHIFIIQAIVKMSFSRASNKKRPTDRTEYPKMSPMFPPKKVNKVIVSYKVYWTSIFMKISNKFQINLAHI